MPVQTKVELKSNTDLKKGPTNNYITYSHIYLPLSVPHLCSRAYKF